MLRGLYFFINFWRYSRNIWQLLYRHHEDFPNTFIDLNPSVLSVIHFIFASDYRWDSASRTYTERSQYLTRTILHSGLIQGLKWTFGHKMLTFIPFEASEHLIEE